MTALKIVSSLVTRVLKRFFFIRVLILLSYSSADGYLANVEMKLHVK